MVEKKKKRPEGWRVPEAPKVKAPVVEEPEVIVSLADVPAEKMKDVVQVRSIKDTTGAFSVDVQYGTPFAVDLIDGDAYHAVGDGNPDAGFKRKLVKGLPRYVWENIIDPSKYWLVKV